MNKLISVIVPVYNNEKFLHRCIQSLVEQEYANIEILLIDDGSSDASPQICDEWAKKDKRINVIHKVNGGVSSARNLGLKECSGKYVCFVDSDDFIDKYFISKMFSKLGDKDLVFCKMNIYNNDTKQITKLNENQLDKLIADKSVKNFYIGRPKLHGSVCRCIFKKDFIFTREKVFNEGIKYCEDLLVMTELILRKPKIDFVNEHLYFYCENMNSVTRDIKIGYSDKFLL